MKIVYTNQFKKDFRKAEKQKKDIDKMKYVINSLFSGSLLEPNYRDHHLVSNWKGYRECYLSPDWLLIYKLTSEELILVRIGSHSDLFD
jgi:mRNA interferase YafQ